MGLFESHVPLESITIMIQKEVADRMQEGPGSKEYGALSLAVQYYSTPKIVCDAPPSCFMPQPKVTSTVITLKCHNNPPVDCDEKLLFQIVRASFNQRRKTLQNGLSNGLHYSKEQIAEAIEKAGFSPTIRGEALSLEDFATLTNVLKGM